MTKDATFILDSEGEGRYINIHPVIQHIPGGDLYATGVFSLTYGDIGMGEIVFDDNMNEWEYTGTGPLSHKQAELIADFIKNYNDDGQIGQSVNEQ